MEYSPSHHTTVNKPIGISGKGLDARSQKLENFVYRDYRSVAEVLATLTTAESRMGHFPIYITVDGITEEWWFKDGVTNSHLVKKESGGSAGSGGPATWGSISGNISNQSDLNAALSAASSSASNSAITTLRSNVAPAGDTLAKLYALIQTLNALVTGTTADGDNVVDTIQEVLTIFSTYPEGLDLVTALGGKIDKTSIINTLTEVTAGKVLDARQGKALKDLIDALTSNKQDKLVSGQNLRTINGQPLLGSTDLTIVGGGEIADGSIATVKLAEGAKFIKNDGTLAFTAPLSMGYQRIMHAAEPVDGDDLATRNFVLTHAVTGGGYLPKLSTYGLTATALANAIAAARMIDVDVSPTLQANEVATVSFRKGINVRAGSNIAGPATLSNGQTKPLIIIDGDFEAGNEKVFGENVDTRFTLRGPRRRLLQWYDGYLMENFRSNILNDPANPDALHAFNRAIASGDNINYIGQSKNCVVDLDIPGAFAVSDTIDIFGKTVNFKGVSMMVGGSCIKRIGSATTPVIRMNGSNGSKITDLSINAPITMTAEATPTFAAIQFLVDERNFPQRDILCKNLTIGSPIGGENTPGDYWEFDRGIIVGTANAVTDFWNSNNDFFRFEKISFGRCKVAFENDYDQAVDHRLAGIKIVDCGTGFKFERGGSLTIDQLYFDRGLREGCFIGPTSLNDRLHIYVKNLSMEHQKAQFFFRSNGMVQVEFDTGFINVAFNEQFIQNGLYELIGGLCMSGPSTFDFNRIKFRASGVGRMFVDCVGASETGRKIIFRNCDGAEHIWFRFPLGDTAADFTDVQIQGRYVEGYLSHLQDATYRIQKNNPHAFQENGYVWLKLGDLLDEYAHDLLYKKINIGDRGSQPIASIFTETRLSPATTASNVHTYAGFIKPFTRLDSLVVFCLDGGTLPPNGYVNVGTPTNEVEFGTITVSNAGEINSIFFFPSKFYYSTGADLVLKSYDSGGNPAPLFAGKFFLLTRHGKTFANYLKEISYNAASKHPVA